MVTTLEANQKKKGYISWTQNTQACDECIYTPFQWPGAWLQYLLHVSTGNTAVVHFAIEFYTQVKHISLG